MSVHTASARYDGLGKEAKGAISTKSGALSDVAYGFGTRFGDEKGTNPEELIGAAHAACFTMALSMALSKAGYSDGDLSTEARVELEPVEESFSITRSDLTLKARVEGITREEFDTIVQGAKENCPVSKLLNAQIELEYELSGAIEPEDDEGQGETA